MAPLSKPSTCVFLGEVRMHGTRAAEVPVRAIEPGEDAEAARHYYVFKLSQQGHGLWKGCWMTDGVRPAPAWDAAPPAR